MRFNLFYDGQLEDDDVDIGRLLEWLSLLRFDLPDDVYVDIDIKEGTKL